MRGRNVVNPEAIDAFIALSACPRRALLLELALKALRRPMRHEEALYSPVRVCPDNAPSWITPEHIASGELYAFDFARCDYAMMIDIQHVLRWLQHGHLRREMSARERRKWEKTLAICAHLRRPFRARRVSWRPGARGIYVLIEERATWRCDDASSIIWPRSPSSLHKVRLSNA